MTANVPEWLQMFAFDRIHRARFVLKLRGDAFGDSPKIYRKIDWMCREIVDEYVARISEYKRTEGIISPKSWLKIVSYEAILFCLHRELFDYLVLRIQKYNRFSRGPVGYGSLFRVGIMGLFAHDAPKSGRSRDRSPPLIDEGDRSRLAADMWWAFRHYIDPSEILTFTRKYRSSLDALDPSEFEIIPALADAVAQRRAAFQWFGPLLERERGVYSN